MKAGMMILVVFLGIGMSSPCFCAGENTYKEIKTVDGKIDDIDWAGSKIVVKWLDEYTNNFRSVMIDVPDNAIIRKGTEDIGLSELEVSDDVTVKYYEDIEGNSVLISLNDTTP